MGSTGMRVAAVALIALVGGAGADGDAAAVPRMKLEEFKKELDQGKVVAIDVRSLESYRAGHVPGSLSVPLSAVSEHVARLKKTGKPIVAYCA